MSIDMKLMQDALRGKTVERVPFLNAVGIARILDGAPGLDDTGRTSLEFPLMRLLTACLLAQCFRL